MGGVAGAKLLAITQPDAALAIESKARIGIARPALIGVRLIVHRRRQLGGRLEQRVAFEAGDADRPGGEERRTPSIESAEVLAPQFRAFLKRHPQPAPPTENKP